MNIKVIRNFSMMALMLGAMFVLTGKQAQAQSSCSGQCSAEFSQCMGQACEYGGCDSAMEQACFANAAECGCNY